MSTSLRLLSRFALALLTTAAMTAPVVAASEQGATGDYLAGRQALMDLETNRAASFLREAAASDWENPLVIERALVALAADGRIPDAADMARHMLELRPEDELAHLVISAVDLKEGRYDAAIKQLTGLSVDTFSGFTATLLHAWALVGDGKFDAAENILAELSDEADFLLFQRAMMADVAGEKDLAIELVAQAYEADPQVARLVEAYSRMLANAGDFDKATDIITAFEATGASHPLVTAVKEAVANKQAPGPFVATPQAGAAETLHSVGIVLARNPTADLGAMLLRLGHYLDPESHILALSLGELLDAHEQHEASNRLYDAIAADSPLKPLATVRVAQNLDAAGDRAGAIRRLTNIINANPDDLEAISVLGDLYRDDEKYAEAAEAYTKALGITGGTSPSDWRFYYVRGIAYERSDEWSKAESDFLRALELNPDQPQVLNYLGYSWVDQEMNLDRALDMIQRAVSAAPNDGYIIDSLGWAYYRLGRFDEAVKVLEQAVQLLPNDAEINDHLGDAYWRTGRRLEARFQWTIASAVDERGEVKERVAPKLADGLGPLPPGTAVSAEAPATAAKPQTVVQ